MTTIVQIVAVAMPINPMATMMAVVYDATRAVAFSNTISSWNSVTNPMAPSLPENCCLQDNSRLSDFAALRRREFSFRENREPQCLC